MRRIFTVLVTIASILSFVPTANKPVRAADLINFDHLRFLTQPVTVAGRDMAIVHIYSEYPSYKWVDAAGEGISAVDDVARAAIAYLWQYERTGDTTLLDSARRCLEFVRYMQAPDGQFYNFVTNASGTINQTGSTSYKSLTWWAMRGFWALGEGVRVFDRVDRAYADQLAAAYQLTESAIAKTLGNYGQMNTLHGFQIPAWLPNGASDSSAIGLLGMAAYYQARPNPQTADTLTKIADGIAAYHLGDDNTYPFGMHPVSDRAPGNWHDWGAHMVDALAVAGMTLHHQDWIDSAAADADSFLLLQLAFERFRNMAVVPDRYGQIAYGTDMIVQAYMALYKATGRDRYARYGGLAASWFFGNNMAGVPMYDPATGRVLDGINGPVTWQVNLNSGAESTIEGLMALIAVADVPLAAQYLYVKPVDTARWHIYEAEEGQQISGQPIYYHTDTTGESNVSSGRYVGLGRGNVMALTLNVPADDNYWLYVAHVRQVRQAPSNAAHAVLVDHAPTINGDLSEWSAIPAVASNSREQLLRGSGLWQGPNVDSHSVQFAWDNQNLYLAVTVRAPQYVQRYTLSDVWHDDAFWMYLINSPKADRLSAKFTLAQTPKGPQIWDWENSRFLTGAVMAWHKTDSGYIYEASIPWASVNVTNPHAGLTIGIEAGRGIGGNSFMDLTGRDPDIAQNLLPLTLTDANAAPGQANALPQPVFLQVQVDGSDPILVPESISPDYDYFWLDSVTVKPIHLTAGAHTLRYAYAGASDDGLSKVDAFLLQAVVGQRTFRQPNGTLITLSYNTLTGEAVWSETF
ncbi:MAG: sugar-binding protein [Aggregatilineales bacterium]